MNLHPTCLKFAKNADSDVLFHVWECVQHASQRGMRAMRVNVQGMRAIHASHASHIK